MRATLRTALFHVLPTAVLGAAVSWAILYVSLSVVMPVGLLLLTPVVMVTAIGAGLWVRGHRAWAAGLTGGALAVSLFFLWLFSVAIPPAGF